MLMSRHKIPENDKTTNQQNIMFCDISHYFDIINYIKIKKHNFDLNNKDDYQVQSFFS